MADASSPDATGGFETFSVQDVIKLQTATFLTLAKVLRDAGVIELDELASILLSHVGPGKADEGWAKIAGALAKILMRDTQPSETHCGERTFGVVEGGLSSNSRLQRPQD